jgi:hypothetical protein
MNGYHGQGQTFTGVSASQYSAQDVTDVDISSFNFLTRILY